VGFGRIFIIRKSEREGGPLSFELYKIQTRSNRNGTIGHRDLVHYQKSSRYKRLRKKYGHEQSRIDKEVKRQESFIREEKKNVSVVQRMKNFIFGRK
jgi:hypothetical protein